MDQDVKKYADSLYESARMESGRTLRAARVKLQQQMAARNSGSLPLSGFDIQAMARLYVAHVDRCTTARFESYQQAYDETGCAASDQDLDEILREFQDVWAQEKNHSASAIDQFITSRGPVPSPVGSFKAFVDRGSAEGYDRVLERLKIWRAKPRRSAPAAANGEKTSDGHGVKDADRRFALLAIEEALKSVPEDERPHPKVGAVVVKDGKVLSKAHRGEEPKSHAEYVALEDKLPDDLVAGATVYTTLEPCTTRKHPKIPCAERLIERKVSRVVIGMFDPNPEIWGKGWQILRDAGIETAVFDNPLMRQCEEMNREFIRAQKQKQTVGGARESTDDAARAASRLLSDATRDLQKAVWSFYALHTQYGIARAARDIVTEEKQIIERIDAAFRVFAQDYDVPPDLSAVAKNEMEQIQIALANLKVFSMTRQENDMEISATQVQDACERIRLAAKPYAYRSSA